jgi:hypothetical protein
VVERVVTISYFEGSVVWARTERRRKGEYGREGETRGRKENVKKLE